MGKRRERRQQASSGRRVKLDLSSDPAVDATPSEQPHNKVVDDSLGEEVTPNENNQDMINDNPLSLLGQYSDDEIDEDERVEAKESSLDREEQVDHTQDETPEETPEPTSVPAISSPTSLQNKNPDLSAVYTEHVLVGDASTSEAVKEEGQSTSQWQAILHDESGQYYYWNVKTGETTWEKPGLSFVVSENTLTNDEKPGLEAEPIVSGTGLAETEAADTHKGSGNLDVAPTPVNSDAACVENENSPADVEEISGVEAGLKDAKLDPVDGMSVSAPGEQAAEIELKHPSKGALEDGIQAELEIKCDKVDEKGSKLVGKEDDTVESEIAKDSIEGSGDGAGVLENNVFETKEYGQENSLMSSTYSEKQVLVCVDTSQEKGSSRDTEGNKQAHDKSSELEEKGTNLMQRLHALAGHSLFNVPNHVRMAIQMEARISDWKALASLGVMPENYWSYIQSHLAQLESVLAIEEAAAAAREFQLNHTMLKGGLESHQPENVVAWPSSWAAYCEPGTRRQEPWNTGNLMEAPANGSDVEEGEILASHSGFQNAYSSMSIVLPGGSFLTRDSIGLGASERAGENDVDMEVDMEVDEVEAEPAVPGLATPPTNVYIFSSSTDTSTAAAPVEHLPSTDFSQTSPVLTSEAWAPPLPPGDGWAPPLPTDSEIVPPPPPEEPPPPPLPPLASASAVQTYSMPVMPAIQPEYYPSEYASEYMPSQEYMSVAEYRPLPDSSSYGAYHEEVPGGEYTSNTQITEITGSDPYVHSDSGQSYSLWTEPVLAPGTSVSMPIVARSNKMPSSEYVQAAPATPAVDPSALPVSTAADTDVTLVSSEAKKASKGKVVKKRTHSITVAPMLTNKKVSSLVNKWKQAKEELHGEEEEEDDRALYDLEVLEKRKQKEIEEWRQQQIASGEALDNANFQPLGSIDWRERVKRAKKADSKEGDTKAEPSSFSEAKQLAQKKLRPNLTEISRSLPTGWQAFWDEASGEVYYGNLTTQETSWDRPVT